MVGSLLTKGTGLPKTVRSTESKEGEMANVSGERIVKTACGICYCACGVLAHVKDGEVYKIEGDPDHPHNKGNLCPKGKAGIELLYHPDRLNFPQKRIGERGEGKWQRISWSEALDTISQRLEEYKEKDGPESICLASGAAVYGTFGIMGYFAYLLGTPNISVPGNICFLPAGLAQRATMGYDKALFANEMVSDEIFNAKCILLWASNPRNSLPYPIGEGIFTAKENGAKLIVVDPRPTDYAKMADLWLQIRPATDDALALGMVHILIKEELYHKGFVADWTLGFDELKKHVQPYTPERTSKITWIPEEKIIAAARMFATTRPSFICQRVPIDQNLNAVQTSRAIILLRSLCGDDFDRKGGNPLPADKNIMSEFVHFAQTGQLPREIKQKRIGAEELPLCSGPDVSLGFCHPTLTAKAILTGKPYKINALLITSHNPISSTPDTKLIEAGLRKVPFSVAMDLFPTPTTELCDIVLPAAGWLERDGLRGHPAYPYLTSISHRAIDPPFERWDDIHFYIQLAKRMKLDIPWSTVEEYVDCRLKNCEATFAQLKDTNFLSKPHEYERHLKGKFEFKTPSKKLELYSSLLEKYGHDPLPKPKDPPELTSQYPFVLIGGKRVLEYVHSAGRQIKSLRDAKPEPTMEMSPVTAEKMNIREGDWVWIETVNYGDREKAKFKAKLVEGFLPQVVSIDSQWWFPERPAPEYGCYESNINVAVAGDKYDPIFGSTNLKSIPCRIYKPSSPN